jgi:hypothetical protein
MSLKKTVAREWVIFLPFFLLSPAVMAIYLWVTAPAVAGGEKRRFDSFTEALDTALFYNSAVPGPVLYVTEAVSPKPGPSGAVDPRQEDKFIHDLGFGRQHTVRKRPFWDYFGQYMEYPSEWVRWRGWWPFLLAYSSYLLVRSVVWAVRVLKGA